MCVSRVSLHLAMLVIQTVARKDAAWNTRCLQFTQHFFNASAQSSTTCFTPPQIFFRWESAHFLCRLQFSFFFWSVVALQSCAMFQILTRFSEFHLKSSLSHRRLAYKPFQVVGE